MVNLANDSYRQVRLIAAHEKAAECPTNPKIYCLLHRVWPSLVLIYYQRVSRQRNNRDIQEYSTKIGVCQFSFIRYPERYRIGGYNQLRGFVPKTDITTHQK